MKALPNEPSRKTGCHEPGQRLLQENEKRMFRRASTNIYISTDRYAIFPRPFGRLDNL